MARRGGLLEELVLVLAWRVCRCESEGAAQDETLGLEIWGHVLAKGVMGA
jgi:hypothetical protein